MGDIVYLYIVVFVFILSTGMFLFFVFYKQLPSKKIELLEVVEKKNKNKKFIIIHIHAIFKCNHKILKRRFVLSGKENTMPQLEQKKEVIMSFYRAREIKYYYFPFLYKIGLIDSPFPYHEKWVALIFMVISGCLIFSLIVAKNI